MSSKIMLIASASLTVLVYSIAYERFKRTFTFRKARILSAIISLGFYFFSRRLFGRKKDNYRASDGVKSGPDNKTSKLRQKDYDMKRQTPEVNEITETPLSICEKDIPRYEDEEKNLLKRLHTTFLDAVANVRRKKNLNIPNNKKLELYGLFKQANVGRNNTNKPGFFDPVGAAKWDAWTSYKLLTSKDAKLQYIQVVGEIDSMWEHGNIVDDFQPIK